MLYYLELCEYGVDSALVVQISRFNTCLDAVTFKSKLPTDGYIVQLSVAMKASLLLLRRQDFASGGGTENPASSLLMIMKSWCVRPRQGIDCSRT
jgi:hypothetical protein